MSRIAGRPDPEELLRQLESEEQSRRRGRLKVFLGYTSGVGKTHRMLHEAKRRWERGEDLVIAALPPTLSDDLRLMTASMPAIARLSPGEAIDVAQVLARKPEVVVADPLAIDNPPESRNRSRWQDLLELRSQIYVSRSETRTWQAFLRRSLVHRLVRLARDLRITVVHDQETQPKKNPGISNVG